MLFDTLLLLGDLVSDVDPQLLNTVLVVRNLAVDLHQLVLTGGLSLVLISSQADRLALDVLELLF